MKVRNALIATALAFGILETTNISETGAPAVVFAAVFYGCAIWLWRRYSRIAAALVGVQLAFEATQAQTWKDAGHGIKAFSMVLGSIGIALVGAFIARHAAGRPAPFAAADPGA